MKTLNVAIIGTKFMGKAHSNAWANSPRFFEMGIRPVLKVAVGTDQAGAQQLADTWGWAEASTDWQAVVARPDIDIVDISTPTYLHCDMELGTIHGDLVGRNLIGALAAAEVNGDVSLRGVRDSSDVYKRQVCGHGSGPGRLWVAGVLRVGAFPAPPP